MHMRVLIASVKESKGTFKSDDGRQVDYDHDIVVALVDGLDPIEVKVAADKRGGARFTRGQEVEIEVAFPKGTRLDFVQTLVPSKA